MNQSIKINSEGNETEETLSCLTSRIMQGISTSIQQATGLNEVLIRIGLLIRSGDEKKEDRRER